EEERLVRRLRFLIANPGNRMLDHRVVEIEIFVRRHADDAVVLSQNRIELARFTAEKSPEIIKAQRVRPAIEWPRWPLLFVWRKMPFADCGSAVTVKLKNLGDRSGARRPICAVTGPTTCQFRNRTESDCMMIPSR